ncbi:hypothetical protein [Streptomyces sp. 6-11-2]|uniref:hypothetical protein n=1 Tax=Streptomyces sp. 6-11-2 TaxID=2585753 RepID=UPI00114366D5|nr:hypothetical protein [Streptomyces sp. 6-11-2]
MLSVRGQFRAGRSAAASERLRPGRSLARCEALQEPSVGVRVPLEVRPGCEGSPVGVLPPEQVDRCLREPLPQAAPFGVGQQPAQLGDRRLGLGAGGRSGLEPVPQPSGGGWIAVQVFSARGHSGGTTVNIRKAVIKRNHFHG